MRIKVKNQKAKIEKNRGFDNPASACLSNITYTLSCVRKSFVEF